MGAHYLIAGAFATATLGAGLLLTGHGINVPAMAQEIAADSQDEGPNLANLLKLDGYTVGFSDGVEQQVTGTQRVRKIAYGRDTEIRIVTTATGVYSTDALDTPHVLYPGVTVEKDARSAAMAARGSYWGISAGPAHLVRPGLPSFVIVTPHRDGTGETIVTDQFTCTTTEYSLVCV